MQSLSHEPFLYTPDDRDALDEQEFSVEDTLNELLELLPSTIDNQENQGQGQSKRGARCCFLL